MVEYGVAPENLRNLISKDDIANLRDGDAVTCSVYDTKQKVKIDNVIGDHGLYAPSRVKNVANNSNTYVITLTLALANATDIIVAKKGQTVAIYILENLELEYETIVNRELADKVTNQFGTNLVPRALSALSPHPRHAAKRP